MGNKNAKMERAEEETVTKCEVDICPYGKNTLFCIFVSLLSIYVLG